MFYVSIVNNNVGNAITSTFAWSPLLNIVPVPWEPPTLVNPTVPFFPYGSNVYNPTDNLGRTFICTNPTGTQTLLGNWTGNITGATNATPIVITSDNHFLSSGWVVTITGVGGNTAANGSDWIITVIDENTFSLDGSSGNGAYTPNSGSWSYTSPDWLQVSNTLNNAGNYSPKASYRYSPTLITDFVQVATFSVPSPAGVVCSYNGYQFSPYIKTKVVEEPIQSNDGRVVKWSKITIQVSGCITQADVDAYAVANGLPTGQPLDSFMAWLRQTLQINGQNLVYNNRGYGQNLNINNPSVNNSVRDVAMGPKAGKLSWYSLGGAPDGCHAAGFTWEVSTCVGECSNFSIQQKVFSEISYQVSYDTDEAGLVTIGYNGTVQIPMSLRNNVLDFNIDSQIGSLIKPCAPNFMRKANRTISPDRSSCTFSVMDRQLEVAYPEDTIAIDMRFRMRQEGTTILSPIWNCTFSGTLRMSPSVSKKLAWVRFFNIVAQRLSYIRSSVIQQSPPPLVGPPTPQAALPMVYQGPSEFEEDIFKNESRFSMTFKIINVSFANVVIRSGIWNPVVGNPTFYGAEPQEWKTWTPNTANTSPGVVQSQQWGGLLQATFDNSTDIILNICNGPVYGKQPIGG